MHEMSIAVELMDQLQALAAGNGLTTIESVSISAGALRAIVPEALDMAFEAVAAGTCAAGAKLALEIVAPAKSPVERADNFRSDYRIPQMFRADLADLFVETLVVEPLPATTSDTLQLSFNARNGGTAASLETIQKRAN